MERTLSNENKYKPVNFPCKYVFLRFEIMQTLTVCSYKFRQHYLRGKLRMTYVPFFDSRDKTKIKQDFRQRILSPAD